MQDIIVAKPYQFVPPITSTALIRLVRFYVPGKLRRSWGVTWPTIRGMEKLKASLAAGNGIILAPNHSRPADPEVMGAFCVEGYFAPYIMASWHLFMQGALQRFMIRASGGFSMYREGLDRESLKFATQALAESDRPVVIFPEGVVSRSNDRLNALMDGVAFVARSAAKQKAKAGAPNKVVIHPIALRYTFAGDLLRAVEPVLAMIEKRLSWRSHADLPLVPRVRKLGDALLAIKEVEYFGGGQSGPVYERLPKLIERVLGPLEATYPTGKPEPLVIERVKKLRAAIVPALVEGKLSKEEADERWRHLADCYFAQQLACYPIGYLDGEPSADRILETVERYEEDLTDVARVHRPMHCAIDVGDAIEVSPDRPRGGDGDPLMKQLAESLQAMLSATAPGLWKG
jgi:1-acyl-sn-glycerol-3-phosphate acyltransferase